MCFLFQLRDSLLHLLLLLRVRLILQKLQLGGVGVLQTIQESQHVPSILHLGG
jgi:hypothetical protein